MKKVFFLLLLSSGAFAQQIDCSQLRIDGTSIVCDGDDRLSAIGFACQPGSQYQILYYDSNGCVTSDNLFYRIITPSFTNMVLQLTEYGTTQQDIKQEYAHGMQANWTLNVTDSAQKTKASINAGKAPSGTNWFGLQFASSNYVGDTITRIRMRKLGVEFSFTPGGTYSFPTVTSGNALKALRLNAAANALEFYTPSSGATAFTGLSDVPGSYSGQSLKYVRVNAGETGLEFEAFPFIPSVFTDLTDVPGSYSGEGGKLVRVKGTEDGLEFFSLSGTGITELNGLTDAVQTFSKVDDTNVTLEITSASPNHEFKMGWSGTLDDSRITSAATWNAKQNALSFADLFGTSNQISLSASGTGVLVGSSNITLSLPQDIATSSNVRFGTILLGTLTNNPATNYIFAGRQSANNVPTLVLQRRTDTTPTGDFISCYDIAGTPNKLFNVDISGALTAGSIGSGFTAIANSALANSAITINGVSTSLGGSTSVTDATLSCSDITTNNSSTSQHGFLKKLSNNAAQFMDGTGNWSTPSTGMSNPMTTAGDIIYGGASGTPTRLAANSTATKKYLQSVSSGNPSWQQIAAADLSDGTTGSGSIALSTSPSFTTPSLGVATGTSWNGLEIQEETAGFSIFSSVQMGFPFTYEDQVSGFKLSCGAINVKTLTVNNSIGLTGTDGTVINVGAATSGKVLIGNGTNMVLSTPTFPNASATSRKIIVSDGTNWVASTETWAVPGTAGNHLISDGTNWVSAPVYQHSIVTSDRTSTSTSLADVTDLAAFSLAAGKTYSFKFILYVTTNATTVGILCTVNNSTAVTSINFKQKYPTSATAFVWEQNLTALQAGTLSTAGPGSTVIEYLIDGEVVANTAGTFALQFKSETGAAVVVKKGSTGEVIRMN